MELALAFAGFLAGVFFASIYTIGWPVYIFIFLLAVLVASAAFLQPRRAYALGAIFLLLLLGGALRFYFADSPPPQAFAGQLKSRVSYEGVVVGDPELSDAQQRVPVQVSYGGETTDVLAVVNRSVAVAMGDRVQISGTLEQPEAFSSDDEGGRVFRYDKYLQKDDIRFLVEYGSLRVVASAPWYSPSAFFARIKQFFLDGIDVSLPEPYASLAGGIVIGGKSGLGTDLLNAFVLSGLVQIVVLSGYNVMIVAEAAMAALGALRFKKKTTAIAGAIAVLIFVLIAGVSTAALRAMLMAFVALYARATGRSYAAGRALALVVFLMIFWNPLILAFDPSFDLSAIATAGLIWLAPLIEIWLVKIKSVFWKNAIATTLAAQIAVLPLLLYETGNLSLVAIPANLLVLPMMPLAMAFSALAGASGIIFGSIAPILASVIGAPAYLSTAYIIFIARASTALPFAAFHLSAFPFWVVLVLYALLAYAAFAKRSSTTDQLRLSKNASM